MTERLLDLPVKIFADGADLQGIAELSRQPYIHGLTTNPTLMRKVGLTDYESFAKAVLKEVKSKPISFEVFSDDLQRCAGKRSKSTSGRTTFTLRSQSPTPVANPLFG
jgi:Transaldolase